MTRPGGAWVPDGRAKAILGDCQASLAVLDGLEIALYLIHATDPRRPWRTALRALTRLVDEGLVKRVGVSNVNRGQLDEALDLDPAVVAIPGAQRPETARSAASPRPSSWTSANGRLSARIRKRAPGSRYKRLPLAFARAHGLDPSRAILIGARPAHRQQRYRCPTRGRCSRRSGTAGPSCPPARCR